MGQQSKMKRNKRSLNHGKTRTNSPVGQTFCFRLLSLSHTRRLLENSGQETLQPTLWLVFRTFLPVMTLYFVGPARGYSSHQLLFKFVVSRAGCLYDCVSVLVMVAMCAGWLLSRSTFWWHLYRGAQNRNYTGSWPPANFPSHWQLCGEATKSLNI